MGFSLKAGDHAFDFSAGVCAKCGMTREHYEDNGEPRCTGAVQPRGRVNELGFILPEEDK